MIRILTATFFSLLVASAHAEYRGPIQYGVAHTYNKCFFDYSTGIAMEPAITLQANDVRVSIDGTETAAQGTSITLNDNGDCFDVALTVAQTTGRNISIIWIDDAGDVWLPTVDDFTTFGDIDAADRGRGVASGMAQTTDADATTIRLRAAHTFADDDLNNAMVCVVEGTAEGECRIITDYTSTTDLATVHSAFSADPTTDSAYIVYPSNQSTLAQLGTYLDTTQDLLTETEFDAAMAALALADTSDITGLQGNISDLTDGTTPVWTLGATIATGTADSGTTTTVVDATLTEADDYWKGVGIMFTSGSIINQTACVYDFVASSDTLTFRPAATAAVTTNTYTLFAAPNCHGVIAP